MAEPLIFINTYPIKEGSLDDVKELAQKGVDLFKEKEPDLVHFALYVNEEGTEVSNLQIHRNAENMAVHMRLAASQIEESRELLDFSKMSIRIYGNPTEPVLEQMRQMGVPVEIRGPLAGFNRFD